MAGDVHGGRRAVDEDVCYFDLLPEEALRALIRHLPDEDLNKFISAFPGADQTADEEWQRRRCKLPFLIHQPSVVGPGAAFFSERKSKQNYFAAKQFLLQGGWRARYIDFSPAGSEQTDAERMPLTSYQACPTFIQGVQNELTSEFVFYAMHGSRVLRTCGSQTHDVASSRRLVHVGAPGSVTKDFATNVAGDKFAVLHESGNIEVLSNSGSPKEAAEVLLRKTVTGSNSIDLRSTASKGSLLLAVARDSRTCDLILHDPVLDQPNVAALHVGDRVWTTRFGADAAQIATGSAGHPSLITNDSALQIWDVESQSRTCAVRWLRQNRGDGVRALFWHNSNTIVSGGWRAVTRVSDIRSGETQMYLVDPTDVTVASVATDSNNCIVTGGMDYNYIRVWDVRNCRLPLHAVGLTSVTQLALDRQKQFYKKRLWQSNHGMVHSVAIDYSCLYAGLSDGLYCLSFDGEAVRNSGVTVDADSKENFNNDRFSSKAAEASWSLPIMFDNVKDMLIVQYTH